MKKKGDSVIIRAYKDEPVLLNVLSATEDVVEVYGDDRSVSIGFTRNIVYQFDPTLFEQLATAYQHGDGQALSQLWRHAPTYTAKEKTKCEIQ